MSSLCKLVSALIIFMGVLTGCSSSNGIMSETKSEHSKGKKELYLIQSKYEIEDGLKEIAELFEEKTGIGVKINSGGYGVMKPEFQGGNEPDIFIVNEQSEYKEWAHKFEDLSDEEWVSSINSVMLESVKHEEKIVALPMSAESFGLIYNKEVLQKANIDIDSLKTIEGFKKACGILEAKKSELGIDYPISYTTKETWVTGDHTFNESLTYREDPMAFVKSLKAGEVDIVNDKGFNEWLDMVDILIKNSERENLDTIDYAQNLADFSMGSTAFLIQGIWSYPELEAMDIDFEVGMLPLPNAQDRLPVGVAFSYFVNKDSELKEEAKEFLNFIASDERAHKILVEEYGIILPFNEVFAKYEHLAKITTEYIEKGKISPWIVRQFSDSVISEKIAPLFSDYAQGKMTREIFLQKIEENLKE